MRARRLLTVASLPPLLTLLAPGAADAQGAAPGWRPLFEDDSLRIEYLDGSVRRVAARRLAMYHKLTFPDRVDRVVLAVEIDCAAQRGRVRAADLYGADGARQSDLVAEPTWGAERMVWAAKACNELFASAPAGHVSELLQRRPPSRWRLLATGANGDAAFVDAETVARRPGEVGAWVRTVLGARSGGWSGRPFAEARHWTLDCRASRYRLGQWATYDSSSTVIRAAAGASREWQVPVPDTMAEQLVRGLCSHRALPPAPEGQLGPDPD